MEGTKPSWSAYKAVRPAEEGEVRDFIMRGHKIWSLFIESIPELDTVQHLSESEALPKAFRSSKGGDFLFRAIALPMIMRCLRRAQTFGMKEHSFLKRFAKLPRALNKEPWLGVLWDGSNMTIGEKNIKMADNLILWMVNCDPQETKLQPVTLKRQLAVLLHKPATECRLPPKVG